MSLLSVIWPAMLHILLNFNEISGDMHLSREYLIWDAHVLSIVNLIAGFVKALSEGVRVSSCSTTKALTIRNPVVS